jgi:hypothetical protein
MADCSIPAAVKLRASQVVNQSGPAGEQEEPALRVNQLRPSFLTAQSVQISDFYPSGLLDILTFWARPERHPVSVLLGRV